MNSYRLLLAIARARANPLRIETTSLPTRRTRARNAGLGRSHTSIIRTCTIPQILEHSIKKQSTEARSSPERLDTPINKRALESPSTSKSTAWPAAIAVACCLPCVVLLDSFSCFLFLVSCFLPFLLLVPNLSAAVQRLGFVDSRRSHKQLDEFLVVDLTLGVHEIGHFQKGRLATRFSYHFIELFVRRLLLVKVF